jgi:hypothetical protein
MLSSGLTAVLTEVSTALRLMLFHDDAQPQISDLNLRQKRAVHLASLLASRNVLRTPPIQPSASSDRDGPVSTVGPLLSAVILHGSIVRILAGDSRTLMVRSPFPKWTSVWSYRHRRCEM